MRKTLLSLALFVMTVMTAMAQFKGTTEQFPTTDYSTTTADFKLSEIAAALGTDAAGLDAALVAWGSDAEEGEKAFFGLPEVPLTLTEGHTLLVSDLEAAGANDNDIVRFYISTTESRNGWGIGGFANSDNWTPVESWTGKEGESWYYDYPVSKIKEVAGETAGEYHGIGITINIYNQCKVEKVALIEQGNANGKGSYWMTAEGKRIGYGTESETEEVLSKAFCDFDWNLDDDAFSIMIGQFPEVFAAGDSWTGKFVLSFIGKSVDFEVTLNVIEKPEIPEAVTELDKLTIVKEYNATLDFTYGKQYEGKSIDIPVEGLAEALGIDEKLLSAVAEDLVYAQTAVNTAGEEEDAVYVEQNQLVYPRPATDGWFGHYTIYDEGSGVETTVEHNVLLNYGNGSTFYLQNYKYADGVFTVGSYGQFPGALSTEAPDYAELYIIAGDKAAKITFNVNVTKPEAIPFEQMEKAGEIVIDVEAEVNTDYLTKEFEFDMSAVLEALGEESVDDVLSWAAEGELSDNHTENSGGFYFNEDGTIGDWGGSATFFIAKVSLEDGKYAIGQHSNKYAEITEPTTVSADLVFIGATKYYIVKVNYTIKPKEKKGDDFVYTKVGTEGVEIQIVPNNDNIWEWETKTALDMEYIEKKIGTQDIKIYTDIAKTEDDVTTLEWTDAYNCDPKPGFWMGEATYKNEAGQEVVTSAGWGINSFGVCYKDGELTWFQYPGQRSAGDEYLAHLYIVNDATGDYLDYVLSVKYVDEASEGTTVVGQEDAEIEVTDAMLNSDGIYTISLDMDKALKALNIQDITEAQVVAPKSPLSWINVNIEEPVSFDKDGYITNDEEAMAYQVALVIENDKPVLQIDPMELDLTSDEPITISFQIGIDMDNSRYIHNITVKNHAAVVTAISNTAASATASAIYNASGAKVSKLQKGINIVKMSDGSVKKMLVK